MLSIGSDILMTWCPAGKFEMGGYPNDNWKNNNETPRLSVVFTKGFWISTTPITFRQYYSILGEFPNFDHNENLPVEGMPWQVAKKICGLLTDRLQESLFISRESFVDLPTEAQWEYACRAGTDSIWHFGNEPAELDNYAWYKENSNKTIHPVAQKLPNQWGIYDMYGNTPEWTLSNYNLYRILSTEKDLYNPLYKSTTSTMIVTRGGGYLAPAKLCRSSTRSVMDKDNPYNDEVGLRIVINSNVERTYYDNNMDNSN